MDYKIGIFGSSTGDTVSAAEQATAIGQALQEFAGKVTLVTGACSGLPYAAAESAAAGGVEVLGFSPVRNEEEQRLFAPDDDINIYKKIIYIPEDFEYANNKRICMKYRNVLSTAACDAGIIISGRWGSLNEFTSLIDMKKTVGVLTGTGGIADELPDLSQRISKEGQGVVIFNDDPVALVQALIKQLQSGTV